MSKPTINDREPGLIGYATARACFSWILASFTIFFAAKHYDLMDGITILGMPDGYLAGVFSRFLSQPFYQLMGLSFVGSCAYGITLLFVQRSFVNNLHLVISKKVGMRLSWLRILVGIPHSVTLPEGRSRFVKKGANYATEPLRIAATLFPALGFLGTVVGVSIAIGALENVLATGDTSTLMAGLRTAFDTTFLGLCGSLVLTILIFSIDTLIAQATALLDDEANFSQSDPQNQEGNKAPSGSA